MLLSIFCLNLLVRPGHRKLASARSRWHQAEEKRSLRTLWGLGFRLWECLQSQGTKFVSAPKASSTFPSPSQNLLVARLFKWLLTPSQTWPKPPRARRASKCLLPRAEASQDLKGLHTFPNPPRSSQNLPKSLLHTLPTFNTSQPLPKVWKRSVKAMRRPGRGLEYELKLSN